MSFAWSWAGDRWRLEVTADGVRPAVVTIAGGADGQRLVALKEEAEQIGERKVRGLGPR